MPQLAMGNDGISKAGDSVTRPKNTFLEVGDGMTRL
jgi:hypothetical protein